MEVLAAIGLAGNIIQFVDFCGKLLSKTAEIQKSGIGALAENINIETATNDLALLSTKLHDSAKSAGDTALRELCQSCDTAATDLLTVLDTVKVRRGQNKWKSFRKALRSVWSKEDIALLEQRLARFRDELNLRVAIDLRSVAEMAVTGSADNVSDRERVIQVNEEQSSRLNDLDLNTKNLIDTIVRQKDVFEKAHTILQRQHLEKLMVAAAAPFNSYDRRKDSDCIRNTRVDLLQEIRGWADGNDKRPIFWLRGLAGTGKSTIARTIAHYYHNRRRLAASFFFSKDIGGDVRDARKFFTTIAAQLARVSDPLGNHICNAINQKSDVVNQAPREQWRQLILEPLLKLQSSALPLSLVLVVDALDECEDEDDIQAIVNLLSEARLLKTVRLRILITSRPEIPIRQSFDKIPDTEHHDFVLQDIPRSMVDHDIRVFIEYHFGFIREEHNFDLEWPGGEAIGALVEHASGLFIWAATACRFIRGRFTEKRLSAILGGDISMTLPEKGLDMIYLKVLQSSIRADFDESDRNEHCKILRKELGAIVTLFASLPIDSLARLVKIIPKDIDESLGDLHAILDIRKERHLPIRLHHPSFRDFLLNRNRCDDLRFWVNESTVHELMANNCIDLLSAELRMDICGLREPGAIAGDVSDEKIENFLSTALRYACRYWVQHLKKSDAQLEDNGKTYNFLRQHLLHWFEALSLLGKISEAVLAIQVLEDMTDARKSPNLHAFIYDSKRFILYNRSIIEEAPLQTYCSALIFTPKESIVRKQFENNIPSWICKKPRVQAKWNATLQTLEGHLDEVYSVAFSLDGKLVASGSGDRTVRLWDTSTGVQLQMLEGHLDGVHSVAFSPDGKLVASGSWDRTVRLWNTSIGVQLQMLEGHSDGVYSVAFSPDGRLVASGSLDRTVRLWDASTGVQLQTLKGHSDRVYSVAFSPDGKLVASGSLDGTVRLWDTSIGVQLQTLDGHLAVDSVAFSPDGKLVASGSWDRTVKLWDTSTGVQLQTLEGHLDRVYSVAFSPDGKLVASGSWDGTVRLWDTSTGVQLQTLKSHSNRVYSVAFSLDGKLVASGSGDRTVRLWDTSTGVQLQTLESHWGEVYSVTFSPDSKLVASSSGDRTVRLWDTSTEVPLQTLEGHLDRVDLVAFSPDGKLVASGSWDGTVRLWDTSTGVQLQTLEGYLDGADSVAFSPDGKLVASGSWDKTVKLWDTSTGVQLQTLEGHLDRVYSVAFSPNSKLIASGSWDKTVRLWDTSTGVQLQTLESHSGRVYSVAFSLDGKLVASGSLDRTVGLWDTSTGVQLQMLEGHLDGVHSVAFSPDSKLIASGSWDKTVRLWDTSTGAALQTLELGITTGTLLFSTSGQYLITDRGVLGVSSLQLSPDPLEQLRTLFVSNDWVVEEGTNILWLSPDYRATCVAVRDGMVVLGHSSGGMSFLEFKEGLKTI